MCGIVGLWCHARPDISGPRFDAAVDSLAHRGPDGRGTFHDADVRLRLGHRRLAILDTTPLGAQPMESPDGRFAIVFNGEIYNFVELRTELETGGRRFRTGTDTEVLLAGFAEWGEQMLLRLNGMWAFVIWDRDRRELFASRDRFGVKPLLYRSTATSFAFASELKAFAALPDAPLSIDAATLAFSPMAMETVGATLLEGVRALPPGHALVIGSDGRRREWSWWTTVEHLPVVPASHQEQVEGFREIFADACRVRLRSDVALGTSLSGGLDSSSVLAMVHREGGQQGFTADWQRAFTQGYPGSAQDESAWARRVAGHVGTTITWTSLDLAHELENLAESVLAFEQIHMVPLGLWRHYRTMRDHGVVVSIDGHGGDELLAGYPRFVEAMRRRALSRGAMRDWLQFEEVSSGLRAGGPRSRRDTLRADVRSILGPSAIVAGGRAKLRRIPALAAARRRFSGAHTTDGIVAEWGAVDALAEALDARAQTLRRQSEHLGPLGSLLYVAFHHDTLPSILRNFDRLSMASGVEIRAPLLDWRLVTYAFALPDRARIDDGRTKAVLRAAMAGLLPDDVRLRRDKKGFASPLEEWLEAGLGDVALEVVHDPRFVARELWDGEAIRARVARMRANNDWSGLRSDWPYIQTELLINGLEQVAAASRAS
jgi:asparagine synthase (glutamine-hydrolysing)